MSEGTSTEISADSLTFSAHTERYVNSRLLHIQRTWSMGREKFESATICVHVPFYISQFTLWPGLLSLKATVSHLKWPVLPVKILDAQNIHLLWLTVASCNSGKFQYLHARPYWQLRLHKMLNHSAQTVFGHESPWLLTNFETPTSTSFFLRTSLQVIAFVKQDSRLASVLPALSKKYPFSCLISLWLVFSGSLLVACHVRDQHFFWLGLVHCW